MQSFSRPALLVLELWGLGDLALAIPFLREAVRHARVTLVTKPQWGPLVAPFCPDVSLVPFVAPWTAFAGKYRLFSWPWRELGHLVRSLRRQRFALGASARPDPRDHLLLLLAGARRRAGFRRTGSGVLLSTALAGGQTLHRAEAWRRLAATQGWTLPVPDGRRLRPVALEAPVVLHSGAARPTRLWPLDGFALIARRLREHGRPVRVLCDPAQIPAWRQAGEAGVVAPADPQALLDAVADAALFVGNDSGPGHVAALCGVPTFTIFGPQLPERFAPVHPQSAWIDGRPCQYKPCFDACRFDAPHCIQGIGVDDVWSKLADRIGQG